MGTPKFLQIRQSLVAIAATPLRSGILARAEAIVGSKRDPSGIAPYRDLAKWLRNSSDQAPWGFLSTPFVVFACCFSISLSAIVPIITNQPLPLAFLADLIGSVFALTLASFAIALSGLDTASPLGGRGATRTSRVGGIGAGIVLKLLLNLWYVGLWHTLRNGSEFAKPSFAARFLSLFRNPVSECELDEGTYHLYLDGPPVRFKLTTAESLRHFEDEFSGQVRGWSSTDGTSCGPLSKHETSTRIGRASGEELGALKQRTDGRPTLLPASFGYPVLRLRPRVLLMFVVALVEIAASLIAIPTTGETNAV
jgi:hypothetical protein